jgi:pseudouridine-5'-phosphate glycosidase/pseudouridine kinase
MPYPQNAETAVAVEQIVRDGGAVPATIALLNGQVHIGLDESSLDELARSGRSVQKCSRRDLPVVMAQRRHGATTVAATMYLARLAGIDVFVTGGVGGVHRGAEDSMDVSADLTELGRTDVAVICAGVKSILDIPRTLEVLETQGVPVMTLGAVNGNFPAFFSPDSGVPTPCSVETAEEAAAAVHAAARLRLGGGSVIAVPNPSPADAAAVEDAVQDTLAEAERQGIAGRDVTPFVLQRVNELTGGASLESNIALVKHNAVTGTRIAVELNRLQRGESAVNEANDPCLPPSSSKRSASSKSAYLPGQHTPPSHPARVVVVGGATIDLVTTPSEAEEFQLGTSMPGTVRQSHGGVGRNIAECLARMGDPPLLLAAVGADDFGRSLRAACAALGMPPEGLVEDGAGRGTAVYAASLDDRRELVTAVADMGVMNALDAGIMQRFADPIAAARIVVVDGNLEDEPLRALCAICDRGGIRDSHGEARMTCTGPALWFEPTSVPKAARAVGAGLLACESLAYLSPNVEELRAMVDACGDPEGEGGGAGGVCGEAGAETEKEIETMAARLLARMTFSESGEAKHVVVTRGDAGCLVVSGESLPAGLRVSVRKLDAEPIADIVNCTGAGDTLVGAAAWALARGRGVAESVECGMRAARLSVMAEPAISPAICELTVDVPGPEAGPEP